MDIYPGDYIDVTSKLQVGCVRKVPHKGCSNSACLRIENSIEGFKFYCFKCREYRFDSVLNSPAERARRTAAFKAYREARAKNSHELPPDFSQTLPEAGLAWLGKAGWTSCIIRHYDIGYSEDLCRVILPVYYRGVYSGYIARSVEEWLEPKYLESTDQGVMWESRPHTDESSCVVCEDILSAGRCGEIVKAYALLGTSLDTSQLNTLRKYERIYLWLDPDKGGRQGVIDAVNRLRIFSEVIIITSDKDPKYLTNSEIQEKFYG